MQHNPNAEPVDDVFRLHRAQSEMAIEKIPKPNASIHISNHASVTRLTFKDKAGLVFVVIVLLLLQLLEKIKLLK